MTIDLPRDRWPDATVPLLRDPYRYISRRAAALRTDAFRTRLMGRTAICMTGPEAARLFYHRDRFRRQGAMPAHIRKVIFGPPGVVQGLDGEAHRQRKAMFMEMMSESRLDALDRILGRQIEAHLPGWTAAESVDLYAEARTLMTAAVCEWACVPLAGADAAARADQMDDTFKRAASVGPPHMIGLKSRAEVQRWSRNVVEEVRAGRLAPPPDSAAALVAGWSDADGRPIAPDIAAAELLSVLRPTVAVAVWVVFLAHALHRHPQHAGAVGTDRVHRHAFVQEVRRLYPFFPLLSAFSCVETELAGGTIPPGTRVVLDIWGTNRDARSWEEPEAFRPGRFLDWPGDPLAMIPQGGGEHRGGHRCPGEWITIRLMEIWAELLAGRLDYDVLTPDAGPDMTAVPALPAERFRLGRVRPRLA